LRSTWQNHRALLANCGSKVYLSLRVGTIGAGILKPRFGIFSLKLLTSITLLFVLHFGCAPPVYYVKPREWKTQAVQDSVISFYIQFLQGRRIFLDPGHGGEDRVNKGPEGIGIEADINLRVGLALREFLTRAGATVFISRTKDTTIALRDRPMLAVASGAEVFISLHHNATGTGDQITNYTSTYYHAYEGHPDYHPANHDLARYIQRDNSYAMRNPSPPSSPTFDGTLSDFSIYPNSGFAVLRDNPLPAVLVEGSFFTHPPEEQRLALEEFNTIEAWGIFVGLGQYFRAGVPQLQLQSDSVVTSPTPTIAIGVASMERIDSRSVYALLDGAQVQAMFDSAFMRIIITPTEALRGGDHQLEVWVRNAIGNASWPFKRRIVVRLPAATLSLSLHPTHLPLYNRAWGRVMCRALDQDGYPVVDGTPIRFTIEKDNVDTTVMTKDGAAYLYARGSSIRQTRLVTASAGTVDARIQLTYLSGYDTYVTGVVRSLSDSSLTQGAIVKQAFDVNPDSTRSLDTSWTDGRYIVFETLPDPLTLQFEHPGYYSARHILRHASEPSELDVWLAPVVQGRLVGKTYLIDPRFGGTENGEVSISGVRAADINLAIARRVHELLRAAGANAVLVRDRDTTIAEAERARRSAFYPRGMYARIDASGQQKQVSARIHQSITNTAFARDLIAGVTLAAGLDSAGISGSQERFYAEVAMGTISLIVPSPVTGRYESMRERMVDEIAWGIFVGVLHASGYVVAPASVYEARDSATGILLSGATVILAETFRAIADSAGLVQFYGLENDAPTDKRRMRVLGNPSAVVRPFFAH
jgi:N-acetylmuramoyl-L-alanine amidase